MTPSFFSTVSKKLRFSRKKIEKKESHHSSVVGWLFTGETLVCSEYLLFIIPVLVYLYKGGLCFGHTHSMFLKQPSVC